jgi:hypothetical protein
MMLSSVSKIPASRLVGASTFARIPTVNQSFLATRGHTDIQKIVKSRFSAGRNSFPTKRFVTHPASVAHHHRIGKRKKTILDSQYKSLGVPPKPSRQSRASKPSKPSQTPQTFQTSQTIQTSKPPKPFHVLLWEALVKATDIVTTFVEKDDELDRAVREVPETTKRLIAEAMFLLHTFFGQGARDRVMREVLGIVPTSIDSRKEFQQSSLAYTDKLDFWAWWMLEPVNFKEYNYDFSEQESMVDMANDIMGILQGFLGFIDPGKHYEYNAKEKLNTLEQDIRNSFFGHSNDSISCTSRHPDGCIIFFAPEKLVGILGFLIEVKERDTSWEAAVDRLETSVTTDDLPNSGFIPAMIIVGPLVRIGCLQNTSGAVKFHEHERFDVCKEPGGRLLHFLAWVARTIDSNITHGLGPRVVGKKI